MLIPFLPGTPYIPKMCKSVFLVQSGNPLFFHWLLHLSLASRIQLTVSCSCYVIRIWFCATVWDQILLGFHKKLYQTVIVCIVSFKQRKLWEYGHLSYCGVWKDVVVFLICLSPYGQFPWKKNDESRTLYPTIKRTSVFWSYSDKRGIGEHSGDWKDRRWKWQMQS